MKRPLSCLWDHARVFLWETSAVTVENRSKRGMPSCPRMCVEGGKATCQLQISGCARCNWRVHYACQADSIKVSSKRGEGLGAGRMEGPGGTGMGWARIAMRLGYAMSTYHGSRRCTHADGVPLGRSCGSPVLNFCALHFANRKAILFL